MRKKIITLILVCSCAFLTASSCKKDTAQLTDVELCTETEALKCKSYQKVFTPATPVIYCTTTLINAQKNTKVFTDWYYIDDRSEEFLDSASVKSLEGTTNLEFSMTKQEQDWPTGDYKVELNISDKNAKPIIKNFKIE